MHVTEYHFYSPLYDDDVVRVSAWNAHGDEYFAIVLDGHGYAQRRMEAAEALAQAIEDERPAGEVWPWGNLIDNCHFNTLNSRPGGAR